MDALRRKLHDQRGVSMLMALLLMLVALMVSAVVVALALSVPTIRISLALHRRKKAAKKQANAETEAPKC